jgi:hypothetical protein
MSEIDPNPFRITDTEGSTFEANLHEKHDIYLLDNCTATSRSDTATVKSYPNMNNSAEDIEEIEVKKVVPQTMTMMQWHRRLGHLNKADILRMARDPGFWSQDIRDKRFTVLQGLREGETNSPLFQNA